MACACAATYASPARFSGSVRLGSSLGSFQSQIAAATSAKTLFCCFAPLVMYGLRFRCCRHRAHVVENDGQITALGGQMKARCDVAHKRGAHGPREKWRKVVATLVSLYGLRGRCRCSLHDVRVDVESGCREWMQRVDAKRAARGGQTAAFGRASHPSSERMIVSWGARNLLPLPKESRVSGR